MLQRILNLIIGTWLSVAVVTPIPTSTPTLAPIPSESPTPSITLIPTPTPEPLVGFCQKVPILMYHHVDNYAQAKLSGYQQLDVTPEWFEKHLIYLRDHGYQVITSQELVTALLAKRKLTTKPAVITIDDGYADAYSKLFPLIKKYQVNVDLAIPAGLIGGKNYLTWEQLQDMVNSGLVHVYNHTWSHAALANASLEKIKFEVKTAEQLLESHVGKIARILVYPYGSSSQKSAKALQDLGYIAAITTLPGKWECDGFIMALRRVRIGNLPLATYGI